MSEKKPEPKKRPQDPELKSMSRICRILDELSDSAADRIVAWLANRAAERKQAAEDAELVENAR